MVGIDNTWGHSSRYFVADRSERDLESAALDAWFWAFRTSLKPRLGFGRRHLSFVSLIISCSSTKAGGEGPFPAGSAEGVRYSCSLCTTF